MDVSKLPYAQWLEDTLRGMADEEIETMAIVAILKDGTVHTSYHNASTQDMILLAGNIAIDGMYNVMKANAANIVAAAEDEDEEEEEAE